MRVTQTVTEKVTVGVAMALRAKTLLMSHQQRKPEVDAERDTGPHDTQIMCSTKLS